jgi:hypothetical protein
MTRMQVNGSSVKAVFEGHHVIGLVKITHWGILTKTFPQMICSTLLNVWCLHMLFSFDTESESFNLIEKPMSTEDLFNISSIQ